MIFPGYLLDYVRISILFDSTTIRGLHLAGQIYFISQSLHPA